MVNAPTAPFFVIGSPRSGTTMLRLMLTSHPQLLVPPECGFLLWLQPQFGGWGAVEFADADNIARFAHAVTAARKFDTWRLTRDEVAAAVAARTARGYADACDAVYRLFAARAGKPEAIWGDKNNYYLAHVGALRALFPRARFLHIVRDGRDAACSYREVMALPSTSPYRPVLPVAIGDIARQWAGDVRTIRDQLAILPAADACEMRYEDLTADPARELTRICSWLGVAFAPAMLRFHAANRESGLEPAETLDWKQRTLVPVSRATVGRYTELLGPDEAAEFVAIAGAELRDYGYLD